MTPQEIAAFTDGPRGGNPAGVLIADTLPTEAEMQRIARDLGHSETAFAMAEGKTWRVRYFAPEGEVPFCGHATIGLGAALGAAHGAGRYDLTTQAGPVSVAVRPDGDLWSAELTSPPTRSAPLDPELLTRLLALFDLPPEALDPRLPPRHANGGADHAVLALRDRARLAAMDYDLNAGQRLMLDAGLVTVSLLHIVDDATFDARNAFASGGVLEDPATGAAAAALGGALVDLGWPGLAGGGQVTIRQGDDMGHPSRLTVTVTGTPGDPIRVAGTARRM